MPPGGGFCSSHTGLDAAMTAPVADTTCVRRKLSAEVSTAWVTDPLRTQQRTPEPCDA